MSETKPGRPLETFAWIALIVAAVAAAMVAAAGPAYRFGLISLQAAFAEMRSGAYGAAGGGAVALIVAAVAYLRGVTRAALIAAIAAAIAGPTFYLPWQFGQRAQAVPPIHDISTDLDDPPPWVALRAAREASRNGAGLPDADTRERQRKGYPELGPVHLAVSPERAFGTAESAARAMGWSIADSSSADGRIEAGAVTIWFGFTDDIVIRVRAEGDGSRVDIRSASRIGRSDLGANAARIRAYRERLERAARG
ncbi:MAG: DUF1499 domain-containing protein [Alphaproteobacteria bacterium]|nr:DUF1499 domain-containing protein [Alphaproteobacteria bacterium]